MRHEVTAQPEKTNQTAWSEDGTAVVCMLQEGGGVGQNGNIHAGERKCTSVGEQHRSEGCGDALERETNKMAALK